MSESEADLASRSSRGDKEALSALISTAATHIRQEFAHAIPRRYQSVLSVDDVLQDAFTTAFLHIEKFEWRGDGSFRAWLTMIAWNSLRDVMRMLDADKRGGDRKRIEPKDWQESCAKLYQVIAVSTSTPSRQVARGEAARAISDAMAQLPELYEKAIKLFDMEERSPQEVAEQMQRSVGACYMLRARALARLSELLGGASLYLSKSE